MPDEHNMRDDAEQPTSWYRASELVDHAWGFGKGRAETEGAQRGWSGATISVVTNDYRYERLKETLAAELGARAADLRDARAEIETLKIDGAEDHGRVEELVDGMQGEIERLREHSAAKDAVVAAARELLACKRGFHADYRGIESARRKLREALAHLDAAPDDGGTPVVGTTNDPAAPERASIVAMISRFEAERMEGKQLEEADGDPLEAKALWNQVLAARMIRKRIERGVHAQPEPARREDGDA